MFAGSHRGERAEYQASAAHLGETLAASGVGIVYGGASVGLMGTIAEAALAKGGEVIGVIPRHLLEDEITHHGLSDLHVVGTMHQRKALMAELSDGFVALPGGLGTFEEILEVLTWTQLGIQSKPAALYNVAGYWDPLLSLLDHAVTERFVRPEHRALVVTVERAEDLIDRLESVQLPPVSKWIDL